MAWHNKSTGAYGRESTEAYDNALMAFNALSSKGWSLTAFCAMWGNVEHESGYNPFRWQSDVVLSTDSPYIFQQSGHAYGLVQWDPASKYINGGVSYSGYAPNFSDRQGGPNDGTAQMLYLEDTAVSSGQYIQTASYPASYAQFKAADLSQNNMYWWTHAWFSNYERGTWSDTRATAASYWYDKLQGVTPHGNIPIWLLFRLKERNSLK